MNNLVDWLIMGLMALIIMVVAYWWIVLLIVFLGCIL